MPGLFDGAVSLFIAIAAAGTGFFTGPRTITIAPAQPEAAGAYAQTGLILQAAHRANAERFASAAADSLAAEASATGAAATATATIPGLLPKVTLGKTPSGPAPASSTPPSAPKKAVSALPAAPPTETPAAPPLLTAAEVLAHTTTTLVRRVGGGYGIVFEAISGGKTVLSWQYGASPIGGSGGVPRFSAAYDCNPPPGASPVPSFDVRTGYDCTLSLTALAGSDLRTISHQFSFSTGPGELSASPPANMNTHLSNTENAGGFAFSNTDTKPVSVLSETFNISYSGLITAYGPLILRLVDPSNESHYLDYHLENIPETSSSTYTHSAEGITLSWPITVPASDARLLPLDVLGVHKLSIPGVDPTVTITLSGVTTDRTDIAMQLGSPHISWSCVVALGYYDPAATSGPFASGEACQN